MQKDNAPEGVAQPLHPDGQSRGVTYDAFISYRRSDSTPLANWVVQRLARFKPPSALLRLLPIQQRERFERSDRRYFLDREFQAANPNFWEDRLEPALRASRFLIVVASPDAFTPLRDGSPNWVVREINTFYDIHREPHRIILVLGPGSDSTTLTPRLVAISTQWDWVDLRDFKAAPWRWLSPRRQEILERELMTIVAALFEVPTHLIPVMRQAQERRLRRARMAAATSVASVLALFTLTGTVAWKQATISRLTRAFELAQTAQSLAAAQDQGSAALVALESLRTTDLPEAELVLYSALSDLRERESLSGHRESVIDAHFTADNGRLLSIAKDNTARVWDTTTGRQLHEIPLLNRPLAIAEPNGAGGAALVLATGQVLNVDTTRGVMEKTFRFAPADEKQLWQSASFSEQGDALALIGSIEVDGRKDFKLIVGRITGEVVAAHSFSSEISRLAWAPDGSFVVVGTGDGHVYQVGANGTPARSLWRPDKDVYALAFSGNGRRLLMAGPVKVQVLDLYSSNNPVTLPRQEISVNSAAANADGTLLALGRTDNCIELWDMTTPHLPRLRSLLNAPCRRDSQYPLSMNELRFLPTGELLSASDDRRAIVWDTVEGYAKIVLAGHGDRLTRTIPSRGGQLLATITSGIVTRRYDIRLWSMRPALEPVVIEHKPNDSVERVALSADETLFATATDKGLVRVFVSNTGIELARYSLASAPDWLLTFGPTGTSLFAASGARAVLLRPGAERPIWEANDATATAVSATERGRTSRYALVATRGQGLLLVDLAAGTARRLGKEPELEKVTVMSVSGNGRRLAYGAGRNLVVVDAVSGKVEQHLSLQSDALAAFWSPGAEALLVGTAAPALEIWNASAPHTTTVHKLPGAVEGVSFDPRGRRAAVRAGVVLVYDLEARRLLAKLGAGQPNGEAHDGAIQDARFSPDGEMVVTASDDRTAAIWRADTGRLLISLVGHGDFVRSAQFTPDGRRVVTTAVISENGIEADQQVGASEAKVILWDAASGKPVAELMTSGDQSVYDALLSRDGSKAVTANYPFGGQPTRTYLLPLFANSEAMAAFATGQLRRPLTPEQRRTLLRE